MTDNEKKRISTKVKALLDSTEWQRLSGSKRQEILQKLDLIQERIPESPPMKVISYQILKEIGHFPGSSWKDADGCFPAVSVREALERPGCVLVFFSDRWLRPSHPDDEAGSKFEILMEWSKWYEESYSKKNSRPRRPKTRN